MKVKELRTILKTQRYPKIIAEKRIEEALAVPQEQLRSKKLKNNNDILSFISICNPNSSNLFPKEKYMETFKTQNFKQNIC